MSSARFEYSPTLHLSNAVLPAEGCLERLQASFAGPILDPRYNSVLAVVSAHLLCPGQYLKGPSQVVPG